MQGKYIVALDQGTTSSRTVVLDQDVNIVAVVQREFPQIYPRPGWVEHDPRQIWATQSSTLTEALASVGISSDEVAAIGITNQRETTVVWEKDTGKPVYNAIVWQCRRTAQICDELRKNEGFEEYVRENTGLLLDPYFSGTKIKWILDNVPGAREKAEKGQLLDIPAATVRTRLRRARKRLKDLLGGDDHEEERLSEFDGAYPAPRRAE